jgi:multiple sugar transport system ATP-binding protein
MNLVRGRPAAGGLEVEGMLLPGILPASPGAAQRAEIVLGIRPEDVEVAEAAAPDAIPARVGLVESLGSHTLLTLHAGPLKLRALVASPPASGEVGVRLPSEHRHWFDVDTGAAIQLDA